MAVASAAAATAAVNIMKLQWKPVLCISFNRFVVVVAIIACSQQTNVHKLRRRTPMRETCEHQHSQSKLKCTFALSFQADQTASKLN